MSGPGLYSRPGSIQTTLKPSSPAEGQVVIHAATVQLRSVHTRERQRICNSKQRAPPALARVSTSALFLPACRCYTRSSLSPSFQLFRATSGHNKCLPHRPVQHAIACSAFVSVFVNASLAPRCSSFQLVSGPSRHRYLLAFSLQVSTCKHKISSNQAKTISRLGLFYSRLGPFFNRLAGLKAVWPVLKPSDNFETVQVLNWSLTYINRRFLYHQSSPDEGHHRRKY